MKANKHAQIMAKVKWKKNPKTKEEMSAMGKLGWTEERRQKQREAMRKVNQLKYGKDKEENKV